MCVFPYGRSEPHDNFYMGEEKLYVFGVYWTHAKQKAAIKKPPKPKYLFFRNLDWRTPKMNFNFFAKMTFVAANRKNNHSDLGALTV
jgi:hypothetical protein